MATPTWLRVLLSTSAVDRLRRESCGEESIDFGSDARSGTNPGYRSFCRAGPRQTEDCEIIGVIGRVDDRIAKTGPASTHRQSSRPLCPNRNC